MIAIAVACWATGARAEPLPTQPYLTIDVALRAATAALDKCKAEGHAVSVEVMNQSAMTLVALHDPFTTIHSAYSAHAKAYTVLSYSFASGETTSAQITDRITKDAASIARIQGIPGLLLAPGAVLIKAGKTTVGAIGVGGSSGATQDEKCAYAGIEAIKDRLTP
jgi:uncharacterized protein GlcG (DUF336 family)